MKRKHLLYVLVMALFLSVLTGMAVAAEEPYTAWSEKYYYAYNLMGKNKTVSIRVENDTFISVSSSNKKVATITKEKVKGDERWIDVKLLNPGKVAEAVVKVKGYEDEDMEDIRIDKYLFAFYKYTNPFKSFKIGKKNYASKFKKRFLYDKVSVNTSGKISYSLKKNWKIETIRYCNPTSSRLVKKGSKIHFKKRGCIIITLTNKKTGVYSEFLLGCKTGEKPFYGVKTYPADRAYGVTPVQRS